MRLNRSLILSLTIVSLLTACQMEPAGNTAHQALPLMPMLENLQ